MSDPAPGGQKEQQIQEVKDVEVKSTEEVPAATVTSETASTPPKKRGAAPGGGDVKRQKPAKGVAIAVGDRGVYFTTMNSGSADRAKRDLQQMLEGYQVPVEELPKDDADSNRSAKLNFTPCSEATKGMGYLKLMNVGGVSPSQVVSQVLEKQRESYESTGIATSSRLLCRVLPIDYTCKPVLEDFRRLAQEVLQPHLGPNATPTTWALEFKARNANAIKKEAVLEVLDSIAPKDRHKVNLNDPEKCVVVQVNTLWCGLSIVPHWAALKKYNLNALITPQDPKKKSAPSPAAPASLPLEKEEHTQDTKREE